MDQEVAWNLRLVKHTERKPRRVWYAVHEVWYDEAGKPWTMTEEPVDIVGDSAKDVLAYLKLIQHDLKRLPVLDLERVKWARVPRSMRPNRSKDLKPISMEEFARQQDLQEAMDDLHHKRSVTLKDYLRGKRSP